jgi:hypothetical protein
VPCVRVRTGRIQILQVRRRPREISASVPGRRLTAMATSGRTDVEPVPCLLACRAVHRFRPADLFRRPEETMSKPSTEASAPGAVPGTFSESPGMRASTAARIGWGEKISYGVGDLASNLVYVAVGSYLTFFYTDVAGIPATVVGTIFLVSRIFDGVYDLLIGVLMEKFHSRFGKARPWLLYLALPYGISAALLFTAPNLGGRGQDRLCLRHLQPHHGHHLHRDQRALRDAELAHDQGSDPTWTAELRPDDLRLHRDTHRLRPDPPARERLRWRPARVDHDLRALRRPSRPACSSSPSASARSG